MTKSNIKDPTERIVGLWHVGKQDHHLTNLTRQHTKCIYDCLIRRRNFIAAQQKSFGRVTDAQQQDLNDIAALAVVFETILK